MTADVLISVPAGASRTYRVPPAITAAVLASGEVTDYTERLSVDQKVSLDDVFDLHTRPITASLGGQATRDWVSKIVAGVEKDQLRERNVQLEKIGYDPEQYNYFGLTAAVDDDLIHTLGRSPAGSAGMVNAEGLTSSGKWSALDGIQKVIDAKGQVYGVALEPDLLAFTASAFMEGCQGVYLAYGEPVMFLDEQPLLAAGVPAAMDSEGFTYAIVDATDTTAVMDVILIKPGPQVFRRDGGAWVIDPATLDSLLSASPPPIVELDETTKAAVLEQVDASKVNQVAPNDDGTGDVGEALVEEETIDTRPTGTQPTGTSRAQPHSPTRSKTPSSDAARSNQDKDQTKPGLAASLRARYDESLELSYLATRLAAEGGLDAPLVASLQAEQREVFGRAETVREGALRLRELRSQVNAVERVLVPALVADAASVHDATPNQKKASNLRKYWVRGVGAAKIAWGTSGDFTRCEKQLRKYLGTRAKGYCAKRHRETVGYWPGDKRNN